MNSYPNADYPEKAVSMADLVARLRRAPERLRASVEGLTDADCEATFDADEWSIRECVEHCAGASTGWTNIFYDAVEGVYDTPKTADPEWAKPLAERGVSLSVRDALDALAENNGAVAAFLAGLPDSDFDRPFKVVAFLTEPFQIKESINWGLVIHVDYHLAAIHNQRLALGKALPWMSVYLERFPRAASPSALP